MKRINKIKYSSEWCGDKLRDYKSDKNYPWLYFCFLDNATGTWADKSNILIRMALKTPKTKMIQKSTLKKINRKKAESWLLNEKRNWIKRKMTDRNQPGTSSSKKANHQRTNVQRQVVRNVYQNRLKIVHKIADYVDPIGNMILFILALAGCILVTIGNFIGQDHFLILSFGVSLCFNSFLAAVGLLACMKLWLFF